MTLSLVPLEYLANRSREVGLLVNLWRRLFRSRANYYRSLTSDMSKQFLLSDLIPGTSLGIRIAGLLSAQGHTVTPFLARHAEILETPFPPTSRESTAAYAHYPYPPIRDPHWPISCVGLYSAGYIAALADENIKLNLPIALALEYLLDAHIITEGTLVVRMPRLLLPIGYDFGPHLILYRPAPTLHNKPMPWSLV
jgi:hypothetical protein